MNRILLVGLLLLSTRVHAQFRICSGLAPVLSAVMSSTTVSSQIPTPSFTNEMYTTFGRLNKSPHQAEKNSPATIPLMFTGIEHFAIASPNPKRLSEWYVSHLEFEISFEYAGNYFVQAKNGSLIEIIPAEGEKTAAGMRTPGMRHIAISVDDFDAAYVQLRQQGVVFEGEPYTNQGNRLVFFTDGDGNLIHLIKREKPLI